MTNEKDVFKNIESMSINIEKFDDSVGFDQKYIDSIKKADKEKNIKEIYKFIDSYERGFSFYNPQEFIQDWIDIAYKENPEKLLSIITEKESLIDIYFLIMSCTDEILCKLIKKNNITNPYLLFGCIRKLLDNSCVEKYSEYISNGFICLSSLSKEIWVYSITYFENDNSFYKILGCVLGNLSEDALLSYAETIKIDHYQTKLKEVTEAFQNIPDNKDIYVLNTISSTILRRWKELVIGMRETKQFFNCFVISSYTNLILWSIDKQILDTDGFIECFNQTYQQLVEDVFCWRENSTVFHAYYFLSVTHLNLLRLICQNRKFDLRKYPDFCMILEGAKDIIEKYEYLWDERKISHFQELVEGMGDILISARQH